jgi:hypothetical protein
MREPSTWQHPIRTFDHRKRDNLPNEANGYLQNLHDVLQVYWKKFQINQFDKSV